MKRSHLALVLALIFLPAPPTPAATILWPTPSEWASWPEYCRAKYAYLRSSETLEFGPPVPTALFDKYKSSLGRAWVFVHHHCAGLAYLQRANLARESRDRQEALRKAQSESRFTFDRIPSELPIYAEIATHLGNAARAANDRDSALKYYRIAMETHPDYAGGYQGSALVLQDQGKAADALEVLLRGNDATNGNSAEIHYFLGMTYLRLNDLDNASVHAAKAYSLGYPLPGLRNKLAAAGKPLD